MALQVVRGHDKQWREGDLSWLLDANQLEAWPVVAKFLDDGDATTFVLNWSRQLGKSYFLCVLAIAFAIRNANSEIKYAAPTAKMVRKIISPHFRLILATCPDDIKPVFKIQDGEWIFPNGSTITVAGCDHENSENLRGQHAHLAIVDEAGFLDDLQYVVRDILIPQTANTAGKLILSSTPASSPGHPYKTYCDDAAAEGYLLERTIYANPRLDARTVARLQRAAGGEASSTWRREYLIQHVIDEASAVLPEFASRKGSVVVQPASIKPPPFYDSYFGIHIGWSPLRSAALAGFYDYRGEVLVITTERELPLMTARSMATTLNEFEGAAPHAGHVLMRTGDFRPEPGRMMSDMALGEAEDGSDACVVCQSADDNRAAAVADLRSRIVGGEVEISESCELLIRQCGTATWNEGRNGFDHNEQDVNFALVEAMVTLNRSIIRKRNPYPRGWDIPGDYHVAFDTSKPSKTAQSLRRMFGGRV